MRPRFAESKALRRLILTAAAVSAALLMQGCVYRMTIQQGNFLEDRSIKQLQVGMTRSQVKYLLGTPMVPDAFDKRSLGLSVLPEDRSPAPPLERHLIVYFQDDKVSKFDNHRGAADAGCGESARSSPVRRLRPQGAGAYRLRPEADRSTPGLLSAPRSAPLTLHLLAAPRSLRV